MLRAGTAAAAALNIEVGRNEPIDCLDRWFIEFGQSLEVTHLWRLVLEVCNSKYWNRLWIIQEIGLAKRVTVFYGRAFCDWVDLSMPISILTYWRETFSQRFDNTAGKSLGFWFKGSAVAKFLEKKDFGTRGFRQLGQMTNSESLTYLLSISANSYCLEPRDRIYGLLGFLIKARRAQIPVDYSKSLYQIYEDVIKSIIRQQQLDSYELYDSDDPDLPDHPDHPDRPEHPVPIFSSTIYLSECLQRALLGPLEEESGSSQTFEDETASTGMEKSAPRRPQRQETRDLPIGELCSENSTAVFTTANG